MAAVVSAPMTVPPFMVNVVIACDEQSCTKSPSDGLDGNVTVKATSVPAGFKIKRVLPVEPIVTVLPVVGVAY